MNPSRLTAMRPAAKSRSMTIFHRHGRVSAMLAGAALALSGCISVDAPDKPIVIELNINIKQEVIYRLAADAENTIEENSDIF